MVVAASQKANHYEMFAEIPHTCVYNSLWLSAHFINN